MKPMLELAVLSILRIPAQLVATSSSSTGSNASNTPSSLTAVIVAGGVGLVAGLVIGYLAGRSRSTFGDKFPAPTA